jgi:hypothetical protein
MHDAFGVQNDLVSREAIEDQSHDGCARGELVDQHDERHPFGDRRAV